MATSYGMGPRGFGLRMGVQGIQQHKGGQQQASPDDGAQEDVDTWSESEGDTLYTNSYNGYDKYGRRYCILDGEPEDDSDSDKAMEDTDDDAPDVSKGGASVISGAGTAGRPLPYCSAAESAGRPLRGASSSSNVIRGEARGHEDGDRAITGPTGSGNAVVVLPKVRVKWTDELNAKFLEAVDKIGVRKLRAVRVRELIGTVEGLKTKHIQSRICWYRTKLKEEAGLPLHAPLTDLENLRKMELAHWKLRKKLTGESLVQPAAVPRPAPAPAAAVTPSVHAPTAKAVLHPAAAAPAVLRAATGGAAAAAAPLAQCGMRVPFAGLGTWAGGGGIIGGTVGYLESAGAMLTFPGLQAAAATQALCFPVGQSFPAVQQAGAHQALLLGALATSVRGVMLPPVNALPAAWQAMVDVHFGNGTLPLAAAGNAPGEFYGAVGAGLLVAPPRKGAGTIPLGQALQVGQVLRNCNSASATPVLPLGTTSAAGAPVSNTNAAVVTDAEVDGVAEDACEVCGRPGSDGGFWIACDSCNGWFCGRCTWMNRTKAARIAQWFCFRCAGSQ